MVCRSYHLWTLTSWSPTDTFQTSQPSHWLPSLILALSRPGSISDVLPPCSVLPHSSWLQGFPVQLLPKRESSWRTRVTDCFFCVGVAPQQSHQWTLVDGVLVGFPGGLLWMVFPDWQLWITLLMIYWNIIALKNIFLKQNLCSLNTVTLMSSTISIQHWV